MRDEIFRALEARWHELYDQYEAVKAALPPIVRWEWTLGRRYDPRPYYFKREPLRGRVCKEKPENFRFTPYYHEYGFDNQNRVIFRQGFFVYGPWETFYRYASDQIEIVTFIDYKGRRLPNIVEQCSLSARRMQHYASLRLHYGYGDRDASYPAPGQLDRYTGGDTSSATAVETWERLSSQRYALEWAWEHYHYEKKLLVRIDNYSQASLSSPWEAVEEFDYDNQGHLRAIIRTVPLNNGPYRRVIYRRRNPGETLASLAERAKARLAQAIPQVIAAAHFDEPLYCLNLYYSSTGEYFPPELLPGLERDRQRKLQEYGPGKVDAYLWWYLWEFDEDGNELTPRLHVDDAETLEACERIDTELNMRRKGRYAARVLYEISQALNQLDWSQYTSVTADFIVYACDETEHTAIPVSLRRSGATAQQLADWRKRGLL